MKHRFIASVLSAGIAFASFSSYFTNAEDNGMNQVLVTTTDELISALENAQAGDEIILREGVYTNDEWLGEWAVFFSKGEGTKDKPIILRSEDPENPATISGASQESKNALYIFGDYWIIKDLIVTNSGKGIMLDNSCYTVISGCEVSFTGGEAVHIRDDSCYCIVEDCYIHDAGTVTPQYGEGIYIGSAKGTEGYGFDCHYNTVRNCRLGPNISADHIDIKEYTIGNIVENCTFDGTGIQNQNGGNSFIEVKGNNTIVRNNVGHRNGCENMLYGFDMANQVEGWGQNNLFYQNTLYLDTTDVYEVKGWNCSAQVFRNTVYPEGVLCNGNRVMEVLGYRLKGDSSEDGLVNSDDLNTMRDYLLGQDVIHISGENADVAEDTQLDSLDLCLMRKKIAEGVAEKPEISVEYKLEKTAYWRMCEGLGDRTITFRFKGETGNVINVGWGYYDPNFVKDDGTTGKWIQNSAGKFTFDENGEVLITVETPVDIQRTGIEIYDYLDSAGNTLDKDLVALEEAFAV